MRVSASQTQSVRSVVMIKILRWQNHFISHAIIVLLSFVATSAVGMVANHQGFQRFFYPSSNVVSQAAINPSFSYYGDIQSYAELALNRQCSAFYPLWPSLIHWLYSPTNLNEAGQWLSITATILFIVSVPLTLVFFRLSLKDNGIALGITLLYTLSPLAIFRVIGYTESIFSFSSLLLLLLLVKPQILSRGPLLLALFGLSGILCLTRPASIQIVASCIFTLLTFISIEAIRLRSEFCYSWLQSITSAFISTFRLKNQFIIISLCLTLGAIFGYCIYGLFCLKTTGNFLQPFLFQKDWNKGLGFRPWLLITSRSPLIDLLGLYLPALLWCIAIARTIAVPQGFSLPKLWGGNIVTLLGFYPPLWIVAQVLGNQLKHLNTHQKCETTETLTQSKPFHAYPSPWIDCYSFWFALYFAAVHSCIVFLTQDRLVSLGRYIFAQPFIFLALGYLYCDLDRAQKRFLLPYLCGVSTLWLINQWIRYGYHQWLG